MYESHFGFSGAPFQLNPDPSFLFESKGHGKALSYLRFGVQQGEGFIVISGDVGAGKTTLVRALLAQLDPERIVAAQVSNTQLDAADLLQTILTAFGVPATGQSKAGLIARMEAFLTSVAATGRRALLIVDEAQNLSAQAIEELRMLSNFQLGHHGLMQSFLVGQPELRDLLQAPAMEQLRQRILASYHLGPLGADETAAYVQHRLRHVGWKGQPDFEAAAFAAIHRRTGGIPRRINMLCNRALLAAFLGQAKRIGQPLIDETADELWSELQPPAPRASAASPARAGAPAASAADSPWIDTTPDELRPVPEAPAAVAPKPAPAPAPVAAPVPSPVSPPASAAVTAKTVTPVAARVIQPLPKPVPAEPAIVVTDRPMAAVADLRPRAPVMSAPLAMPVAAAVAAPAAPAVAQARVDAVLALADDAWSWAKLRALALRWASRPGMPRLVLVNPGSPRTVELTPDGGDQASAGVAHDELHLGLPSDGDPARAGLGVAALLAEHRAGALIVAGRSYALLHGALAARQAQIPVVRIDAGEHRGHAEGERGALSALLDRTAELLCVASLAEQQDLAAEGFPARRVVRVGPLAASAMQDLSTSLPPHADVVARSGASREWLVRAAAGFGLITGQFDRDDIEPADALQWMLLARHAHLELPLLWVASAQTAQVLAEPSIRRHIVAAGIVVMAQPDALDRLTLLERARCVVAGPGRELVDEARAVGLPAIVMDLYGDTVLPLEGGLVTQVGPSTAQVKSAVRDAVRWARPARGRQILEADAAEELVRQIERWMAGRERFGLDEMVDEAVA